MNTPKHLLRQLGILLIMPIAWAWMMAYLFLRWVARWMLGSDCFLAVLFCVWMLAGCVNTNTVHPPLADPAKAVDYSMSGQQDAGLLDPNDNGDVVVGQDLHARYLRLLKKYHPDFNPEDGWSQPTATTVHVRMDIFVLYHDMYVAEKSGIPPQK